MTTIAPDNKQYSTSYHPTTAPTTTLTLFHTAGFATRSRFPRIRSASSLFLSSMTGLLPPPSPPQATVDASGLPLAACLILR